MKVVQAINRVQCRKVVDSEGNCPPTDIFIVLPDDKTGDAVLENLKTEMPGMRVETWAFELDGNGVTIRKGSSHEALIALMANRLPGETSMSLLQKELGLSDSGRKTLAQALSDASHELTRRLGELGVRFVMTGLGRGARSYLLKA